MKVLVFGYSVTAERNGFVERCARLSPEHDISKVAIGGLQPDHARHLIDKILHTNKPDALVIEIATAGYREKKETPELVSDHSDTIQFILEKCRDHHIKCGILDFPREVIRAETDWMTRIHTETARNRYIPHMIIPLDRSLLWDAVHPTDAGNDVYASHLKALISQIEESTPNYAGLRSSRQFMQYEISDMAVSGGRIMRFSRSGYDADVLLVDAGETLELTLPDTVKVIGVINTMGPRTGKIMLDLGTDQQQVNCYDERSYYTRLNGSTIPGGVTGHIKLTQTTQIPSQPLVKGEKDTGPREGGIAHILYELPAEKIRTPQPI